MAGGNGPATGGPDFGAQVQIAGLRQDLLTLQREHQNLMTEYQKISALLTAAIVDCGGVLELPRATVTEYTGKLVPMFVRIHHDTGIMEVALTNEFKRAGDTEPVVPPVVPKSAPQPLTTEPEREKPPRERIIFRDGEPVSDA